MIAAVLITVAVVVLLLWQGSVGRLSEEADAARRVTTSSSGRPGPTPSRCTPIRRTDFPTTCRRRPETSHGDRHPAVRRRTRPPCVLGRDARPHRRRRPHRRPGVACRAGLAAAAAPCPPRGRVSWSTTGPPDADPSISVSTIRFRCSPGRPGTGGRPQRRMAGVDAPRGGLRRRRRRPAARLAAGAGRRRRPAAPASPRSRAASRCRCPLTDAPPTGSATSPGSTAPRGSPPTCAVRRTALEHVGGFDERFPRAYREDTDLALRLLDAGWRLTVGRRRVRHPVRPARRGGSSVRLQRGNADDVLLARLHGRDWRARLGVAPGALRSYPVTTALGLGALAALAAGHRRCRGCGRRRLGGPHGPVRVAPHRPRPPNAGEVATMVVTSAAIPPAALRPSAPRLDAVAGGPAPGPATAAAPRPPPPGPPSRTAGRRPAVERIAVVRALPGLGDLLCAVPALRAVRARWPAAHVTLVGLPAAAWFVSRYAALVDDLLVAAGVAGLPEIEPDAASPGGTSGPRRWPAGSTWPCSCTAVAARQPAHRAARRPPPGFGVRARPPPSRRAPPSPIPTASTRSSGCWP